MHNDHMDPPISAFQLPAENLRTQSIPLPISLMSHWIPLVLPIGMQARGHPLKHGQTTRGHDTRSK